MTEITSSGLSMEEVLGNFLQRFRDIQGNIAASVDDMLASVMGQRPTFVAPGAIGLTSLLASYPASAENVGKYARVSDLYGSVDDVLRCRFDGVSYRWVPQRADYNASTGTAGMVTLSPLYTAPTIKTAGNLTGNITFSPVSTNAYIGQRFRIVMSGGLGIYTAQVTGLIGSNLSLLGNTARDIEYSSSGWFSVAG